MANHNHPFHLVSIRPWPFLISLSLINNFIIVVVWFHDIDYCTCLTFPCTLLCIYQWLRDIIRESTYLGLHTILVHKGLRLGIILFILSEILFFLSFFWAYFHSSLTPSIDIGISWPPRGVTSFNPFDIPLLNSIILISSGLTITWSHYAILNKKYEEREVGLLLSVNLGVYFTILQLYEYREAFFTISDSIYGSIFFIATGFHGLHVIIGTFFLTICVHRIGHLHFSSNHHFGFEAAAWYWHFVDVVWLFLYISIYWWRY